MIRTIRRLIIHCAASPNGRQLSNAKQAAEVIDGWHRERGFQRSLPARRAFNPHLRSIGYHYVIDIDGFVYSGRHPDEIGAHAQGHNSDSLGVCLVGTDQFTKAQWAALRRIVEGQRMIWPNLQTLGHRDLPNVKKTCPGFSVDDWERGGREALKSHILEVEND